MDIGGQRKWERREGGHGKGGRVKGRNRRRVKVVTEGEGNMEAGKAGERSEVRVEGQSRYRGDERKK